MSHLTRALRASTHPRQLILPLAAVAVIAVTSLSGRAAPTSAVTWTPMSPVNVAFTNSGGPTVTAGLLGINDFHGAIDKPSGSGGAVNGTPAGGSEYLATTVKQLRAAHNAAHQPVVTVAAGDLIGASPLVSAAFHDEPAIEEMNNLGLNISSVGNHEFDEGTLELRRMQRGGCHPVDGCQDGDPYNGAKFQYLSANVVNKRTGHPFFPAYQIRRVGGVKVAFIGETLQGTAGIVNPNGIKYVQFLDEVTTANKIVRNLRSGQGIRAFVLLLHQGGFQNPTAGAPDPNGCANFSGDVAPIVAGLDPAIGVVLTGHTHQFYSCALPNKSGANSVVTSAGNNGRLVTDITVTLSKRTGRFTAASANNVIVTNSDPNRIDPGAKAIADKYRTAIAPIANRVVGSITADIDRTETPAGETPLGDVIADGMKAYTTSAGVQLAFMNPGGIRADLVYANSSANEGDGVVTYGEAFAVQPFNNLVVTVTLTGDQIKAILEQQFQPTVTKILQVSNGFTYTLNPAAPAGSRITDMQLNGVPVVGTTSYRVTTNDFLANGGDGFTNFAAATNRTTAPGFDVDALAAYLGTGPIAPGPVNRITLAP
ncbi:MAG: bifunctional metallophosphatase/5'-nucleotidase [Mycobacteriales bacterium]